VCNETLRLHPVAGSVARTLTRPMQLGAWSLPAGVAVSPSIIGLHRRPDLYPEPEVFRPERFLDRTFAAYEYMPFGGGHRRCIGAAFASYELKIVLGTLLRERPLRLVTDRPIGARPRSTVIGPAEPIELVLA
jgi:cytochrome P450